MLLFGQDLNIEFLLNLIEGFAVTVISPREAASVQACIYKFPCPTEQMEIADGY
jgi:hypothetical protein